MTTNSIFIRTVNIDDLETLLQFEKGVINAERPLEPFLAADNIYYYNIPQLITSKKSYLIVAASDKELVASGYIRIKNSKQYQKKLQHGYIGFICVKPTFRAQKSST